MIRRKNIPAQAALKPPQRVQRPSPSGNHRPGFIQPKSLASPPVRAQPAPPPPLRPQPVPKVLQTKKLQTGATIVRPTTPRRSVQRLQSGIVQAAKFYPNLHPGAIESIDRSNIFRLESFANQYRLRRVNSHGVNVPNQQYNFVRTREGEMLLHARYRHPSIAEGKQVLYAGEIFFNNAQLEWWSNGSGHYQPQADDAAQANLPMDYFFSYQQIIKGEHTRKKA